MIDGLAHVGQGLAIGDGLAELIVIRVDEDELPAIGRKTRLAHGDPAGDAANQTVLEGQHIRAANFVILEIEHFVPHGIEGADMIEDAAEVVLAPDGPAAIARVAIGQLDHLTPPRPGR